MARKEGDAYNIIAFGECFGATGALPEPEEFVLVSDEEGNRRVKRCLELGPGNSCMAADGGTTCIYLPAVESEKEISCTLPGGILKLDIPMRTITDSPGFIQGDNPQELTKSEFLMLQILMQNQGKLVTKSKLCEVVYNYTWSSTTSNPEIQAHMKSLRRKLNGDREVPKGELNSIIRTVRSDGYVIPSPPKGQ